MRPITGFPLTQARRTLIVASVLVCVALCLAAPAAALAKEYSMGPVSIGARLNPDGSLDVAEQRTFDFQDSFTRVYWELDTEPGQQVTDIGVAGPEGPYTPNTDASPLDTRTPGTFWVEQRADGVTIHAFHVSAYEAKTFALNYRVTGAATKWEDTGELYWQFIGARWEVPASDVNIRIALPWPQDTPATPGEDLRAWGHGPLTGTVQPNPDGTIDMNVPYLEAQTFVELRTLFPRELLANAPDTPGSRLDLILAQEKGWADSKNRQVFVDRVVVGSARWGSALLSIGGLVFAALMFMRHGKEYAPQFKGEYFREEPADLHPALVGALWRMGTVEDGDVAATLMDLANRGVVTMMPIDIDKKGFLGIGGGTERDWQLTVDRSRMEGARPLDRSLVAILFGKIGHGDSVTISKMKAYAKSHAQEFSQAMQGWKAEASAEAQRLGFTEKEGNTWQVILSIIGCATMIIGIFGSLYSESIWVAIVAVVAGVGTVLFGFNSSRRSPEANELYAKYRGVRNYLRDFSRLNEAPPSHVALWNHFLVLAVVFGIAQQVIEQMRVKVPEIVQDQGFATTYWWVYSSSGYGGSPISALQSGITSAGSIASSELASSSGGGGGFSGGGGGGGAD